MGDVYMTPLSIDVDNSSEIASISVKIIVGVMLVLFFVLAFCFVLSLFARWYLWRISHRDSRHGTRSTRVATRCRGLRRATLMSLPVVVYDPKDFKEGLECSVCLSETLEGEKVRLLPNCNHGFHLECIDTWFKSHSTCPLCRNLVVSNQEGYELGDTPALSDSDPDSDSDSGSSFSSDSDDDDHVDDLVVHSREALAFPTNVLFWGNQAQVRLLLEATNASPISSSSPRDELVIEIPTHICDDSSRSQPSNEEEAKTPVVSRLVSLKRLLSRGTRVVPWASSGSRPSSSSEVEPDTI